VSDTALPSPPPWDLPLITLEGRWRTYRDDGLVVLGVPCDQFGDQEPGEAPQILAFCQREYGITFPLLAKTEVNGEKAHPLYQWLKKAKPGFLGTEAIKWSFTKFLVDREGTVRTRYGSIETPERIGVDLALLFHQPIRSGVSIDP